MIDREEFKKSEETTIKNETNSSHQQQQQAHNQIHHKAKSLINEIRNELGLLKMVKSPKLTGKKKLIKYGLVRSDSNLSISKVKRFLERTLTPVSNMYLAGKFDFYLEEFIYFYIII